MSTAAAMERQAAPYSKGALLGKAQDARREAQDAADSARRAQEAARGLVDQMEATFKAVHLALETAAVERAAKEAAQDTLKREAEIAGRALAFMRAERDRAQRKLRAWLVVGTLQTIGGLIYLAMR